MHIEPGVYQLRSAFVLDTVLDANTTWATAANDTGRKATLSGGIVLNSTWSFNDSVSAWQTHLPSLPSPPTAVHWNGTCLPQARSRVLTAAGRIPGGVWGLTFAPGDIPESWEISPASLMKWRLILHRSWNVERGTWNVGHHTVTRVWYAPIARSSSAKPPRSPSTPAGQRFWSEGVDKLFVPPFPKQIAGTWQSV